MAIDATPAAQRRRLSRFPAPSPRPGSQLPAPSTPAATPPPNKGSRKSRLSAIIYSPPDSTSSSPSLSAPPPFDWDAARSNAAPPYGPLGKINAAASSPGGGARTPKKRIFRKATVIERIQAIPSRVAFEMSMFPHNLPLPPPQQTGKILGVLMHITHISVKWAGRSQAAAKEDPDDIWKSEVDWGAVGESYSSWSWSTPIALLLLLASLLNALYMFTRIRTYQLRHRNELVKSAHAFIVTNDLPQLTEAQSPYLKALYLLLRSLKIGWRLTFGSSPSPEDLIPVDLQTGANKVQQLEVWNPGELESKLFIVYSPAHFLIWRVFSSASWFSSLLLMGAVSLQLHLLFLAHEGLIKDKAILAAEVLHEYDTKFVNPRLRGIKKDVGTMTHEAEMFDGWGDFRGS